MKQLVYSVIVVVVSTLVALILPHYIVFDSPNQDAIHVKLRRFDISDDALEAFINGKSLLSTLINKETYKDAHIWTMGIAQYELRNSSNSAVDVTAELDPSLQTVIERNNFAYLVDLGDRQRVIKMLPGMKVTFTTFSINRPYLIAPQILFYTGSDSYQVEELAQFEEYRPLFGIDPSKNVALTAVAYLALFGVMALFVLSGIAAAALYFSKPLLSKMLPDSEYLKMLQRLSYLKRNNPKRMRAIIRDYRRHPPSE